MTAIKLDKSKPYGQVMGATNGARFEQNGKDFDHEGNLVGGDVAPMSDDIIEIKPKLGRPSKK